MLRDEISSVSQISTLINVCMGRTRESPRGPIWDCLLISCTRLTAIRLRIIKQTRDMFRPYRQVGRKWNGR